MADSSTRRLRDARNLDAALLTLGLAMLWPMLRAPFIQTVLSVDPVMVADPHVLFDLLLCLIGLALVGLAAHLGAVFKSSKARCFLLAAATVSCLAGVAVLLAFDGLGRYESPFMALGAALLAFGMAVMFVAWSNRVMRAVFRYAASCLTASFLISFVFGALDRSSAALRILCFVLPLGTAGLLAISMWWHERCTVRFGGFTGRREGGIEILGFSARKSNRWAYDMVLLFILVGLVASAVMRSLWMHDSVTYQMRPNYVSTYVISITLAMSYLIVVMVSKGRSWGLLMGLALTMLALFGGIVVCAFAGPDVGLGSIASSHTAFEFLLWSFFTLTASGRFEGSVRGIGVWLMAEGATSLLATVGLPRTLGITADTVSDLAFVTALISMSLIAVSFVGLAILLMREMGALAAVREGEERTGAASGFSEHAGAEADAPDAAEGVSDEAAAPVVSAGGGGSAASRSGGGDPAALSGGGGPAASRSGGGGPAASRSGGGDPAASRPGDYGRWLVDELICRYGLTQREAQVAASIAYGNSVKKTAETLYIAPSTVQGYTKSIYRKMGINRRQSLVDVASALVEERWSSEA